MQGIDHRLNRLPQNERRVGLVQHLRVDAEKEKQANHHIHFQYFGFPLNSFG